MDDDAIKAETDNVIQKITMHEVEFGGLLGVLDDRLLRIERRIAALQASKAVHKNPDVRTFFYENGHLYVLEVGPHPGEASVAYVLSGDASVDTGAVSDLPEVEVLVEALPSLVPEYPSWPSYRVTETAIWRSGDRTKTFECIQYGSGTLTLQAARAVRLRFECSRPSASPEPGRAETTSPGSGDFDARQNPAEPSSPSSCNFSLPTARSLPLSSTRVFSHRCSAALSFAVVSL
jgi:hypothetical protein